MNKTLTILFSAAMALSAAAQSDPVTIKLTGKNARMSNGLLTVQINEVGRLSNMKSPSAQFNLLSSNGIYFDYTAESNKGLSPDKVEIIRQDDDYAEVVYSNTKADVRFSQGYILRRGESGIYTYVIMEGTATPLKIREARVCTRTQPSFLQGYVDDVMSGKMPTTSELAAAEGDPDRNVQDATYRLDDGSIYTKYDWAQYIDDDLFHGLMNTKTGIWNIPCSYEWINGGPMRQELTVHGTGKSPITIQMLQGEHFGASAMTLADGQKKIYGPFFIYVNSGETTEAMIADARAMAVQKTSEWPFDWFQNDLFPQDRATVSGQLRLTDGGSCEGFQMVLAAPGEELYRQTGGYIYWAKTDENGYFSIPNVRKGDYSLYAYATRGTVTDEMEMKDVTVDGNLNLGAIYWHPSTLENLIWSIGENNRKSDGFKNSDLPRAYGHWSEPEANLTFVPGQSDPKTDWFYAQTKNGSWTVSFNLDKAYEGDAVLTASVAGATNSPRISVEVNGVSRGSWSFYNDAGIYRSARLGGRHAVRTVTFPASDLKVGQNTVTLKQSGIGRNGGVMWDCIKLEAGNPIPAGIDDVIADGADAIDAPYELFNLAGQHVGTFSSLTDLPVAPGVYIYRHGSTTGKIIR